MIAPTTAHAPRAARRQSSFDDMFRAAAGRPSGFDYMRIVLAVGVLACHTWDVSYGLEAAIRFWDTPVVGLMELGLPMFFVLSGFLVAASLERCRTLLSFFGLRALRIYPALIAETLFSALLVGPLLTSMPLQHYFADPAFRRYLANLTGNVSYGLPGLFLGNPLPGTVNLQLWTVPWELVAYGLTGVLAVAGIRRFRILAPVAVVLCLVADAIMLHMDGEFRRTLSVFHDVHSGGKLVALFFLGVAGYLYRAAIPMRAPVFWAAIIASPVAFYAVPAAQYLTLLPVAYATLYLGLANPPRLGIARLAPYSYGIYLYGWVVQQAVAQLLPWSREWYLNLAIALPVTLLLAMLSSRLIESPAQRLKRPLFLVEARWLALRQRRRERVPARTRAAT